MRTAYATIYTCDSCGTQASVPEPKPSTLTNPPPGWWNEDSRLPWVLNDPFGARFSDFCPDCLLLTFGQLTANITARMEAMANGRRSDG